MLSQSTKGNMAKAKIRTTASVYASERITLNTARKLVPVLRQFKFSSEADALEERIQRQERIDTDARRSRYNDSDEGTVHVYMPDQVPADFCDACAAVLKDEKHKGSRALYLECRRVSDMLTSDDPRIVSTSRMPDAVTQYLEQHCTQRGWLFRIDQDAQGNELVRAYLPIKVEHHEDRQGGQWCTLTCVANGPTSKNEEQPLYKEVKEQFSWHGHEAVNETASTALRRRNLYAETEALNDEYDQMLARFHEVRLQHNELFNVTGAIHRVSSHWRTNTYFATKRRPALLVNDESIVQHEPSESAYSSIYRAQPGSQNGTRQVPHHGTIYAFDITRHEEVWAHSGNFLEYQYKDIEDKLVLPASHAELVDSVVHDLGFVAQSDVVGEKGTGTPVLSIGKPGSGKTLLAEVVSHRLRRPLYKINGGYLLGDENNRVAHVEEKLTAMLQRSERQKLIPLIDEADVMIATRRADNLTQAAIVAAFLRTLEYFNGLLFLTSNREEIDDAILSRMAAVIRFNAPDREARKRIWEIQAETQAAKLPAKMIGELAKLECSGRDINRLLSLALRYERAGKSKLTLELFHRIAVFRGIELRD